jgi:hypothetical protein
MPSSATLATAPSAQAGVSILSEASASLNLLTDKGANTFAQAAAFVSAVHRGHWLASYLFAASQVPLALEDLFNFSKDENQIISDRIGGAIYWFPHINRIISSGATTVRGVLCGLGRSLKQRDFR